MLSSRVKLALAIFNRKPRGLSSVSKAGLGLAGLAGAGAAAHLGFDQYRRAAEAAKHLGNIAEAATASKNIANEVPGILESSISQTAPDSAQDAVKALKKLKKLVPQNDLGVVYPSPIDVSLLDDSAQGGLARRTNETLEWLRKGNDLDEIAIQNITNKGRASYFKNILNNLESQPNLSSSDRQYMEDLKDRIYSEEMEEFKRNINPFDWRNSPRNFKENLRSYLFGVDRGSEYLFRTPAPRRLD